jgi:hypothetical protein
MFKTEMDTERKSQRIVLGIGIVCSIGCLQGLCAPPPGFELENRDLADPIAERQASEKRMVETLKQETRDRERIRGLPGGQEALAELTRLNLAREKREKELLQPVEAVLKHYEEVLKKKLAADALYQERCQSVTTAQERVKGDTELADLFKKHRDRIAGETKGELPTREQVLAAIRDSDDRPLLRRLLERQHAGRQGIMRLQVEAGNRQCEIEKADQELLEIKKQESTLLQQLKSGTLARDEQLQKLAADITAAKIRIQELESRARSEPVPDK